MRNVCWIIFALFPLANLSAQETQWAYRVLGYSSQAGYNAHSAKQALGEPDKLPAYGDAGTAWAPGPEDQNGERYIKVGFRKPMPIRQVMVAETNQAGSVDLIYAYDRNRKEYLLYDASMEPELKHPSAGRLLSVVFKQTRYPVYAIKVVLKDRPEWKEDQIDAIGISQSEVPWQPAIQVTQRFHYPGMVTPLDNSINSAYSEVLPRLSPDGERLYFCRKNHPDNYGMRTNDDIWVAAKDADGQWAGAQNVGWPLNDENHNYVCSVGSDKDGSDLLTLGNGYRLDRKPVAGVSQSFRSTGKWVEPLNLQIEGLSILNLNAEYFLSADRKTLILAMESWDTKGGKDLYVAHSEDLLHFGKPVSLGSNINTAGREMAPFLSADEQFLFFSSDGFPGYGDQDIFVAERLDETWTTWSQPENLGPQVNSPGWDSYFSYHEGSDQALLASNRSHYANEDIYLIKMTPQQPEREIVHRDREHPLAGIGYSIADLPKAERLASGAVTAQTNGSVSPSGSATRPGTAIAGSSSPYHARLASNAADLGSDQAATAESLAVGLSPASRLNSSEAGASAMGAAAGHQPSHATEQASSTKGGQAARQGATPFTIDAVSAKPPAAAGRAFAWEQLPEQPIATPPLAAWDNKLPAREAVLFPTAQAFESVADANQAIGTKQAAQANGTRQTISGRNGNALANPSSSVIIAPLPFTVDQASSAASAGSPERAGSTENAASAESGDAPGSATSAQSGGSMESATGSIAFAEPTSSAGSNGSVESTVAGQSTSQQASATKPTQPILSGREQAAGMDQAPAFAPSATAVSKQETSAPTSSRGRKRSRRSEQAAANEAAGNSDQAGLTRSSNKGPSAEGRNQAAAAADSGAPTKNSGTETKSTLPSVRAMRDGAPVIMIGGVHDVVDGSAVHATLSLYSEATGRIDMRTDSLQPLYAVGIPAGTTFEAVLRAPGYFTERFTFDASDIAADGSIQHDFQLVPIREGQTISLENIYFDVNSASLQAKSHESLDRWASLLANHPGVVVQIQGHTNNRCSPRYCVELSQKRAKSVSQYLGEQGVGTDRLRFRGFGSESPVANNHEAEGRARNQRVELKILKAE